jgi:DNA-binding transcriptional MerR regulator
VYSKHQLAEMFGVSVHTVNKYRDMGILPPTKPPRGCTAAYGADAVEVMRSIWGWNGLKDTNRTLKDVAEARQIAAESAR